MSSFTERFLRFLSTAVHGRWFGSSRYDERPSETRDETLARISIEEAMTAAKVLHCHNCQAAFIKVGGCNIIKCSRCSVSTCYLCRNRAGRCQCPLYAPDLNEEEVIRQAGIAAAAKVRDSKEDSTLAEIDVDRILNTLVESRERRFWIRR